MLKDTLKTQLKLILNPCVYNHTNDVLKHFILRDLSSKVYINDIFKLSDLASPNNHLYFQSIHNSNLLYLHIGHFNYINKLSLYNEKGLIHEASIPEKTEKDFNTLFRKYVSLEISHKT